MKKVSKRVTRTIKVGICAPASAVLRVRPEGPDSNNWEIVEVVSITAVDCGVQTLMQHLDGATLDAIDRLAEAAEDEALGDLIMEPDWKDAR